MAGNRFDGRLLRASPARRRRRRAAHRSGDAGPPRRSPTARVCGGSPLPRSGMGRGVVRLAAGHRGARGGLVQRVPGAARAGHWTEAATDVLAALAAGRGTYRHPFAGEALRDALTRLALAGPPSLADSVLTAAVAARPGWATLYELRALVALRDDRCDAAASQFLVLVDFGIEREDAPERI